MRRGLIGFALLLACAPAWAVIAYDTATESNRTGVEDPYTFSHTGRAEASGGVQGAVLLAIHGASNTDHISSVTYGGVSMTRVTTHLDSTTEPGRADIWFVGSGLSGKGGAQTLSIDLTSATTDDFQFVAVTFTAGANTESIDNDGLDANQANPTVTLQYGGRTAISLAAFYSGDGGADLNWTPNANCTDIFQQDLGAFFAITLRQTTPGTADFAIGGTIATDDVAYAAAAFSEVLPPGTRRLLVVQ